MVNKEHLHSIRVGVNVWQDDERFEYLMKLLTQYGRGINDVALGIGLTHSPCTVENITRIIEASKKCLLSLRKAGFSAGFNNATTIGHHAEDLDSGLGDRYTFMTGADGTVCQGSYCMRNPDFLREYVVACYTELANAHPDFIWIDDDVRFYHFGSGIYCFCDRCIALFNEKYGYQYTRETLKEALNENHPALGMQWLEFQSDGICHLLSVIAETVYGIDPKIQLGLMTGERYNEGYQFARFAHALSQGGKHEIMWRPGGGAYDDFNIRGTLEKMQEIGRQNAYLPDYVSVIQSEIENFPYNVIKKTPRSTAFEIAMGMTAGSTGASLNILPAITGESFDTIIPHLKAIGNMADYYRLLQDKLEGLKPSGIHTGWRPFSLATSANGILGRKGYSPNYGREMFFFGLPEAYHPDYASVTMLSGQDAAVMSDEEILKLLSGGVYLTVSALEYLRSRGFGDLMGFAPGESIPLDAREQYLAHPLNEGIAGGIRNCRQAFNRGDSFAIIPLSSQCQVLSRLIDYHGRGLCDCTCGVFENCLGGRICVSGYFPMNWICDIQKTKQLQQIFLWLSKGTLPAYVQSYERIRNITLTGNGRTCVTLNNPSNDEQTDVAVAVLTDADTASFYLSDGTCQCIQASHTETHFGATYRVFVIDRIAAFDGGILVL